MDQSTRPESPDSRSTVTLPAMPPPASAPPPHPAPSIPDESAAGTGWTTWPVSSPPAPGAETPRATSPIPRPATGSEPPPPPYDHAAAPAPPAAPRRGRAGVLLAGVAIGALFGGAAGAAVSTVLEKDPVSGPVRSDLSVTSSGPAGEPLTGVQSVAEQVLPSVVSITGQLGPGTGSGVVISSDGEILTNNHVVVGISGPMEVLFSDGTTAEAEVIGTDPLTDLAVVKAKDVADLTPAVLGSSDDLNVGQQVVAIGSPLGLSGTVTSGIVSAMDRPVIPDDESSSAQFVINAIQTDAPINPGNSGGPLVDMNGEVVGINNAIATNNRGSIGLGFSIPIDQAKPIVQELLDSGEATHAQLGVGLGGASDSTPGPRVVSVMPGSGAEQAGLQVGDVIVRVDDRQIPDVVSLIASVRTYRPGDEITVTYRRNGEEQTATVTLGSDAETT